MSSALRRSNALHWTPEGRSVCIGTFTGRALGTSIWHIKADRVPISPMSKQKYIVEMDLTVFETDSPPQHMWDPHGKNYKVLPSEL